MSSTTPYAAIPYPGLADTPNVPADMQAMASRLDAILSLAIGGGSTIPGTSLSLSSVPGQIATLNARPVTQQAYVARASAGMQIASNNPSELTVQTLTIPSQTYLRFVFGLASSTWNFLTSTATTDTLGSRLIMGGTSGFSAGGTSPTLSLPVFTMQTLAAGSSLTLTQTVSANQLGSSPHTATLSQATVYALCIPWFGSTFAG